ncbi:hypothetical protein ACVJDU_000410 [Bradyrhizobium diazoefficiens]
MAAYLIISADAARREHQRRLVQRQRAIDVAHHLAGALVGGADHDAVRELEVADRRALAQEFGVGGDDDVGVGIGFADDALDLVAGADRHGRLGHHDGEARQRLRDLFRGGVDVGQIGVAVTAARRRADRDEDGIGVRDRLRQVGGEVEPLGLDVGRDQLVEPGLVDRDLAAMERRDLLLVLVDAGDVVTEIRKAGPGHQSHIARSDHRDSHEKPCLGLVNETPMRGGLAFSRWKGTVCEQKPARELNR